MDDVLCIACPMREHPGGSVQPGDEDIKTTRQIVLAGQILEIEVLDHLIVAQGVWVSLREQRLGGWENSKQRTHVLKMAQGRLFI